MAAVGSSLRYDSQRMTVHHDLSTFRPRRGLGNAHAQTLAGNFLPRTNHLPPAVSRLFEVEPGAQVLCHCHWQPEEHRRSAMTMVMVHGLEGSSESRYMIGLGSKAWLAGMNVVRMNMRNCGGTEELTPTLYHSGLSADVGAVVEALAREDMLQRMVLVGYSMGGNLVLKLAGEWGANAPAVVKAVAGVSPAMDLAPSADALHDRKNRVYEWRFLRGLRRRYQRKTALFPQRYDAARSSQFRTIREFDHVITAFYSGFTSADDYYSRASSARVAEHIAMPALVVHALDDPFIRMLPATRAKLLANPHVTFVETEHGGHCAFLADANGYDGRWAERLCVEFAKKFI